MGYDSFERLEERLRLINTLQGIYRSRFDPDSLEPEELKKRAEVALELQERIAKLFPGGIESIRESTERGEQGDENAEEQALIAMEMLADLMLVVACKLVALTG